MATLPTAAALTGANITKEQQRVALEQLRQMLNDVLGTTGTPTGALAALGLFTPGAIGSLVFALHIPRGPLAFGEIVSGADLQLFSFRTGVPTAPVIGATDLGGVSSASTLSGSWRFLGDASNMPADNSAGGVFIRVA